MSNKIPIGYINKTAADVTKNDFIKELGKVLKCSYAGEHNITDEATGIYYRSPCVALKYRSALTGSEKEIILPFSENVQILYCEENIEDFEFDFLPLKTDNHIVYKRKPPIHKS